MNSESQNDIKDNEVLAQLYKKGAKETPPAKLNYEIINYAANPDKSAETTKLVGSHFGGGWKVPLSMAASVVVVFALLVQLDQSPQQLELPPIPDLSLPTEDSAAKSQPMPDKYNDEHNKELHEVEEALADDASSFKNDRKESDIGSQNTGALIIEKPVSSEDQRSIGSAQPKLDVIKPNTSNPVTINRSTNKNAEKKIEALRERVKPQQEPTPASSPSSSIIKSKSEEGYATPTPEKAAKPQATAKDKLNSSTSDSISSTTSGTVMQERSMKEHRDHDSNTSGMAADAGAELSKELNDENVQSEAEYAPIPVEEWLTMIERLVAQKDYAEAARQLEKFKQAHPKVNVEDLDAKIP